MTTIIYRGREGRRVNGKYLIRFLVKTSDGKEFWSYGNRAEAERQAIAHCANVLGPDGEMPNMPFTVEPEAR
jgi:hypothetical protein